MFEANRRHAAELMKKTRTSSSPPSTSGLPEHEKQKALDAVHLAGLWGFLDRSSRGEMRKVKGVSRAMRAAAPEYPLPCRSVLCFHIKTLGGRGAAPRPPVERLRTEAAPRLESCYVRTTTKVTVSSPEVEGRHAPGRGCHDYLALSEGGRALDMDALVVDFLNSLLLTFRGAASAVFGQAFSLGHTKGDEPSAPTPHVDSLLAPVRQHVETLLTTEPLAQAQSPRLGALVLDFLTLPPAGSGDTWGDTSWSLAVYYSYVASDDADQVHVTLREAGRTRFTVDFRRSHGGETHHRYPSGDALKLHEFLQKLSEKRAARGTLDASLLRHGAESWATVFDSQPAQLRFQRVG